jgi:hypothetical protein
MGHRMSIEKHGGYVENAGATIVDDWLIDD